MATVDDWSDLVTVNYQGGYGGEFFSFLLYESFHGEIQYIKGEYSPYRYNFTPIDPLKDIPLFYFNVLTHSKDRGANNEYFVNTQTFTKHVSAIKKICYDDNRKEYIKNLQNYILENYLPKHKKNNVTKMHNFLVNENSISIQEIFPKSTNYDLICKNESEHFIFRILFFYKTICNNFIYYNDDKILFTVFESSKYVTIEYIFRNKFEYFKSEETGIKIDVFDLFINEKNDLNLNIKKLKEYKKDILYILKKFEIDIYHTYTKPEMYEVLRKYLKKNNTFEKKNDKI
jgi:hypothetical protein